MLPYSILPSLSPSLPYLSLQHKFTNEVVHAINLLQTQQKRQLSGIEEFRSASHSTFCLSTASLCSPPYPSLCPLLCPSSKFCAQEMEAFKSDFGYQEVYGKGLKAVASASLAADW